MQNLVMGTYCIEQLHGKYETINGWFLHVCNSELVQQRKQCRSRRFPRRAVVSSANLLLFALSLLQTTVLLLAYLFAGHRALSAEHMTELD